MRSWGGNRLLSCEYLTKKPMPISSSSTALRTSQTVATAYSTATLPGRYSSPTLIQFQIFCSASCAFRSNSGSGGTGSSFAENNGEGIGRGDGTGAAGNGFGADSAASAAANFPARPAAGVSGTAGGSSGAGAVSGFIAATGPAGSERDSGGPADGFCTPGSGCRRSGGGAGGGG